MRKHILTITEEKHEDDRDYFVEHDLTESVLRNNRERSNALVEHEENSDFQYHENLNYLLQNNNKIIDISTAKLSKHDHHWIVNKTICKDFDSVNCLLALPHDRFASATRNRRINIWDLTTQQCIDSFKSRGNIFALTYFDNEKLINGSGKEIEIWDLKDKQCIGILSGHLKDVRSLANMLNGLLASGSTDCTIRIWDVERKECLNILQENGAVYTLTSLVHNHFASGTKNKTITIWDIASVNDIKNIGILQGHQDGIFAVVAVSNNYIASASKDGSIRIWNIETNNCTHIFSVHDGPVYTLAPLKNNKLISGGADKRIIIWDIQENSYITTIHGHNAKIKALISFSNGVIVSGSEKPEAAIRVWTISPRSICHHDVFKLFLALEDYPSIECLKLDNYILGDEEIAHLIEVLKVNTSITQLSLRNCNIQSTQNGKTLLRLLDKSLLAEQELDFSNIPIFRKDFPQEPKPEIINANKVTVRVWLPQYLKKIVGHASIQTYGKNGIYGSFWPGGCNRDYVCFEDRSHFHNLEQDSVIENQCEYKEFNFYTLNVCAINNAFRAFKDSHSHWALLSSGYLRRKGQINCSGLVLYLLMKAGIQKFLPPSVMDSFIKDGIRLCLTGNLPIMFFIASVGIISMIDAWNNIVISPKNIAEIAGIAEIAEQRIGATFFNKNEKIKLRILGFLDRHSLFAMTLVSKDFKRLSELSGLRRLEEKNVHHEEQIQADSLAIISANHAIR